MSGKLNKINDLYIKNLILDNNNGKDNFKNIIEHLSGTIYSFPKLIAGADYDACSDFYEYILIRMKKIISLYRQMNCKFQTWFIVVLKRHYYNWYKIQKRKVEREFAILNRPTSENINEELIDVLCIDNGIEKENNSAIIELVNSIPQNLSMILKLHYFDFFDEKDLLELASVFEINFSTLLNRFHEVKERVMDRAEGILEIEEKVGKAYEKLFLIANENDTCNSNFTSELKKYKQAKSEHKKKLKKLKQSYNTLKNSDIAYLLNIPSRTVANLLFRAKIKLKESLEVEKVVC